MGQERVHLGLRPPAGGGTLPPPVITAAIGPDEELEGWSPGGASYFVTKQSENPYPGELPLFALEERRAADGSLVRAVGLGSDRQTPFIHLAPDERALVVESLSMDVPSTLLVFE